MMVPAMVGSWAKCYSWSTVVPLGCVLLGEESWVGEGDGNWFWVGLVCDRGSVLF